MKFDIHFLGLPWEIFFGVITDDQLHLKPLKDVKKKNAMFFKLFWYKAFVHWKLKLLNFLVESVLKHKFCALSRVTVATSNSTYATDINIIKEIKGDHKNQP